MKLLPLFAAALLCQACITERTVLRPTAAGVVRQPAPEPGLTRPDPADPSGKVARPVGPESLSTSRVVVAVKPLGSIEYDGMVLPLVSPDARFIAVQQGRAPAWPAVLAEPDAAPPLGTTLVVYDLTPALAAADRPGSPRLVDWPSALPPACLLGRSADDRGFLVEQVRPDAPRRIGRVEWLTGNVEWLTSGDADAAHATLGPDGELAYSRRSPQDPQRFELVYRPRAEDPTGELVLASASESYVFPLFSSERDRLYVLALANNATRIGVLAVARPASGAQGRLRARARDELNVAPSMLAAYQAVVAVQTPLPAPTIADRAFAGVLVFDASINAVAWLDPVGGGRADLAPGSVAAAPLGGDGQGLGLLVSTPRGLLYQRLSAGGDAGGLRVVGREVAVLAGGGLPRSIARPGGAGEAGVAAGAGGAGDGVGGGGTGATHLLMTPPTRADDLRIELSVLSPVEGDSPAP
jgi:hypothetical protein